MTISTIIADIILFILCVIGIFEFGKKILNDIKTLTKEQAMKTIIPIIQRILLYEMSVAEEEWEKYEKSGDLKKSAVISRIYEKFPDLKKVLPQEDIISEISHMIDNEMKALRTIMNNKIS